MKFIIGLIVSFAVGVGCRYFDVPVGSPAVLPGAFIVLAMTAGYSWTNQFLNARNKLATTTHLCGGPTGRSDANDQSSSPGAHGSEQSLLMDRRSLDHGQGFQSRQPLTSRGFNSVGCGKASAKEQDDHAN